MGSFREVLKQMHRDQIRERRSEVGHDPIRAAIIDILKRWIDAGDCEKIWETVEPLLKVKVEPTHFVLEIVDAALVARKLKEMHDALPGLGDKARKRTTENWRKGLDIQALYYSVTERKERLIGRERTGPRVQFMRTLSEGFERWCGQPLDGEVAALTEIALGERDISSNTARMARRRRSTRPRTVDR